MRDDLPSGTVTFLFTDVEGSTKLLHELGAEAYAQELAAHRVVIRKACTSEGGVEVDTQGDAFFFVFPTAPGAVAAASSFTDALAAGPISVRVGLHTGTPLLTEEGYVGPDVHFAARVAATSHGGQVVLSQATRALLAEDLSLLDLGEHRLKDIPEAVPIYQLGGGSFPPLKTISNTNLPRPASSFLGRERELAEVLARIEQGARLLTLTGPGGTGKTRLALEAASSLVGSYKAGVFWVGLATLRDPALVSETIAETLGAKDGLASHIGERELCLLLDNLEQVVECAPELSALLSACPNLTLLCTSRELLRVQGEVEYAVPPLAEAEAVSLFCARAQAEPSPEISELCARLDSLPLAVELAAARTKALTPAQILERLSQRLDLLRGGRDADPRQQTLRATIEWSYELLSEEEQRLFARLSVFGGGCTLEAAEEVCAADLDTLQSLLEKSLLRFTPSETGGRYWLLETIHEYAAERLEEAEVLRRAHAEHFRRLVESARPALRGLGQTTWLDRLDVEHDNLRASLAWLLHTDPRLGAELASALTWFWQLRNHLGEGEGWLSLALSACEEPPTRAALVQGRGQLAYYRGELEQAEGLMREAAERWEYVGAQRLSESLVYLGVAAGDRGDPDEARTAGDRAVATAREVGDPWTLGLALWGLGANLVLERCPPNHANEAREVLTESVAILRGVGDPWALAASVFYLGSVELEAGNEATALELYEEAAALLREVGDKWRLAVVLSSIARLVEAGGDDERARRLDAEVEALERHLGRLKANRFVD